MQTSRRQFLRRATAAVVVSPLIITSARSAPSERVRIAYISCGGRAKQIMPMFGSHPDCEVVAISDVNEPRMEQAMDLLSKLPKPQTPERVLDYRRILDRKDVDAVVIATTQHWHGLPHIYAAQAKKHIFVEKPLSHTVVEGRAMVQASKKFGVISLMGTQQRSGPHYQKVCEIVQSGRLGKIALVECWNYHNTGKRTGRPADAAPPKGLHWDLWLGPAPTVAYNPARMDNSWWFDYGGGMMTNWAIHHIDAILWAMNEYSPKSVTCSGGKFYVDDLADTPDTIEASWVFSNWLMQYHYRGFDNFHSFQSRPNHHGFAFHGNKACLIVDRFGYEIWDDSTRQMVEKVHATPYFDQKDSTKSDQDGPYQRMFIDCVKQNKSAPVDLEHSHKATVCCHLANIAYVTRSTVEWNAAAETIANNPAASAMLSRPRRKGYELPQV